MLTRQWQRSAICPQDSFTKKSADQAMAKTCHMSAGQLYEAKC
ncbi:MAG: hypothetical protein PHY44_01950 [Lachnospiraceae bacterium]|nr:hypothetical protein [Lachnospiraceae bacterium]